MNKKTHNINSIGGILKGSFITGKRNIKHIPFLLMLVVLALINIRSSFHSEELLARSISLEKEVEDLRLIHVTTKLDLMKMYKRSVIESLVDDQYLQTSLTPPQIIEIR